LTANVLSTHLIISLEDLRGWRSEAVTKYKAGSVTELCTMLAVILKVRRIIDDHLSRFIQRSANFTFRS